MNLLVESVSPIPGSSGLYLQVPLVVIFDRLVDESTIDAGSFVVTTQVPVDVKNFLQQESISANTTVSGQITCTTVAGGTKTQATFQPTSPLDPTCTYKIHLKFRCNYL